MFCTIMIHPFQCENCRMWETGEKGQLERRLHRIMNLEEYLNKKKMCLLCFLSKERILWKLSANSLSRSIIAPAFFILGLIVMRKLLAVPEQNLCWWPQWGPFWGMTIFLAFSSCPCTQSLPLAFATESLLWESASTHLAHGALLAAAHLLPAPDHCLYSLTSSLINILEVESGF